MQRYMFEINIEGQTLVARVSLEIVNIDDNAPVIQVFDTCSVPVSITEKSGWRVAKAASVSTVSRVNRVPKARTENINSI